MHLTSPEDELAIRDIENDLLSSIGSLSADASASFTSATNPSRPDSRSPILNMGESPQHGIFSVSKKLQT